MEMPGCDKAALQQVSQLWSMLDDMSAKDPEEYRKFIERQLREGADMYSTPQPHACIRADILVLQPRNIIMHFIIKLHFLYDFLFC